MISGLALLAIGARDGAADAAKLTFARNDNSFLADNSSEEVEHEVTNFELDRLGEALVRSVRNENSTSFDKSRRSSAGLFDITEKGSNVSNVDEEGSGG